MKIVNIAGYKFVPLTDLSVLQKRFFNIGNTLNLKGTVLLSPEGINIMLAGTEAYIQSFQTFLQNQPQFTEMHFRKSFSDNRPFQRLKIKIKKEIITLRQSTVTPSTLRAPSISPQEFKQWLDENRDITVLDTRNNYEIEAGAFQKATHLNLKHFCEFPEAATTIDQNKPIVMYCTGGIRCEKAALFLLQKGYKNVYQLDGGILNYFSTVGSKHYEGNCYVFDERTTVSADEF